MRCPFPRPAPWISTRAWCGTEPKGPLHGLQKFPGKVRTRRANAGGGLGQHLAKTTEVLTDPKGNFLLENVKLYDKTVFTPDGRLRRRPFPAPTKGQELTITSTLAQGLDGSGLERSPFFTARRSACPPKAV